MQMHGMNYGNQGRGFGGQPQPQRQGGRRGSNRGGFRNSRFEPNQRNGAPNMNQGGQGGQRPNEQSQIKQDNKPDEQQTNQVKQSPMGQQTQQKLTTPIQQTQQKLTTPMQQAQQKLSTPMQQAQQKLTTPMQQQGQQKQATTAQQGQQKQTTPQKQQNLMQQQQQNDKSNEQFSKNQKPANQENKQQNQSMDQSNSQAGNRQTGNWTHGNNKPGNRAFAPKPQGGQPRNQRNMNPRNGPQQNDSSGPKGPREEQMLANKLKDLMGPLIDLPPMDQSEVKFNGRSRLYIGNLSGDVSEDDINSLFSQYGETAELFINKEKNFGFIKLDYRANAEKAKRDLDGKMRNGRALRVRFAPHNSAVRVKNLPPFVSNELLYKAFEIFGKIERAYVKVDERGKPVGEGVVEYQRKPSALAAFRNCNEKCFFLTSSLRPVIVENYEEPDEFDGYQEKNLPKKHPEFLHAREMGPRFSESGSFEHEYGTRWKQLHELHRQKEEALKAELAAEEEKLEAQMEFAKYEHETELLRAQLRQREQDRERQKRSWEMAERAADERREHERATLLRQEEELSQRMRMQDDELRRRQQENTLFVQAQRLNTMLDRQEQGMYDNHSQQQPMEGGFRDQFDMGRGYDEMMTQSNWEGPRQIDDYPSKRRRY